MSAEYDRLLARFGKHKGISCWISQIFSLDTVSQCGASREWRERDERSAVFCMQGRRDNNEDRAVIRTVAMLEGVDREQVHIWAVMDGHGGQVSQEGRVFV